MQLIPVIDLIGGQVVRAERGNRSAYKPIVSPLCTGADPLMIASAMIAKAKADILYIADLDSIMMAAKKNNRESIIKIADAFPQLEIWLDAGFYDQAQLADWRTVSNLRPVIGTEMHTSIITLESLLIPNAILSLDYKNDQLLGPKEILNDLTHWPRDIILMTLDVVGNNQGPDFKKLKAIHKTYPNGNIFAAGGVRSHGDLSQLQQIGIKGALVSSALHFGDLS